MIYKEPLYIQAERPLGFRMIWSCTGWYSIWNSGPYNNVDRAKNKLISQDFGTFKTDFIGSDEIA